AGSRRHRLVPAVVRGEPADLEEEGGGVDSGSDGPHLELTDLGDHGARDAVRDHDRVDPPTPHDVLHVAADGGDGGHEAEGAPVDPMEPKMVVGVPEEQAAITEIVEVEGV